MNLTLVGTNHRYSDIRAREKLSFSRRDIVLALRAIHEEGVASGAVILSTCQRVEIYGQDSSAGDLKKFLRNFKEIKPSCLEHLYVKEGPEAVRHLFKVSAGLDSQIIGELEILNQVRDAYLLAKGLKATTPSLNRLFERAIFAGRFIRKTTGISDRDPSIAASAVRRATEITGLEKKNIFIIGAGTIAKKIAMIASHKSANCIVVANRTFDKATLLAAGIGGRAIRFDGLYSLLNEADIIFSATGSRHLILKKETLEKNRTAEKPLVIFDLAFPRDIDPAIAGLKNVTLFGLDDFKEENLSQDIKVIRANELVTEKADRFLNRKEELWRSESARGQALLR